MGTSCVDEKSVFVENEGKAPGIGRKPEVQ
jgi:hypothetical protein